MMRLPLPGLVLGFAIGFAIVGCDSPPATPDTELAPVGGGGPSIGVPPLLGADYHPGWTNPRCQDCHALPVTNHTVIETHVCAQCHGANGACLVNGYNDEYNEHQQQDDCIACHVDEATAVPGNHGFTDSALCSNCHFRELGQRACEEYEPPPLPMPMPTDDTGPQPGEPPQLSDELVADCYGFPTQPFGDGNTVPKEETWRSILQPGDLAVDFTLPDTSGQPRTLSEMLVDGPVWLQTGSYTCPVYQTAVRDGLNALAAASGPTGAYSEQIQFVHVYTVEAHPAPPDVGAYDSTVDGLYSTLDQPTTMEERFANAQQMEPIVDGAVMLVDGLGEPWGNNPMWCTYATCPSCSFLIGRDGYIYEVLERTPNDIDELAPPLDAFLATQLE